MADWSAITPPGPKPVEEARQTVTAVVSALKAERERLEAARAAVLEAEQADRLAMASAISSGRDPAPDEQSIASARAAVETCMRRVEAGKLALADAEAALGQQVEEQRDRWLAQTARDLERARKSGVDALTVLEEALRGMQRARAVGAWLSAGGGAETGRPAKLGLLPALAASRAQSQNGDPVQAAVVLGWLRDALAEPSAPEQQVHARGQWPVSVDG